MKRGFLIYEREDAERNRWFVGRLREEFARKGARLDLVVAHAVGELPNETPDFVIARTRNASVNRFFEGKGIPVFNNSMTCLAANDKYATYELCRECGIPVLPTVTADEYRKGMFDFPVVVKTRDGHGGKQVFCARDYDEACRMSEGRQADYIVQPMCSAPGIDMRVYMLGGEVVAAAERRGEGFRSNWSLGGKARIVQPPEQVRRAAKKICARLGSDWIGVDFLPHDGGYVLGEIEDPVGARMLYALTDIDVARRLADYFSMKI